MSSQSSCVRLLHFLSTSTQALPQTTDKNLFCLLLTLHTILLKIKASYHKLSHSLVVRGLLVFVVDVYIICSGISGPYYPQIDG